MNKQLLSLIIALVLLGGIMVVNGIGQRNIQRQQLCSSMRAGITQSFTNSLAGKLEAHAADVYDFTTSRNLYGTDENMPLPLASLTKLMTVRVAMKTVKETDDYTVTKSDIADDGGVGFVAGDTYSVHDLLEAALIASSNDAATMIAKSTKLTVPNFISLMNFEAQNLSLNTLRYSSVTGLDTADLQPTVTGSASDVLKLLYHDQNDMPDIMALGLQPTTTIHATNGRSITLQSTNDDVEKIGLLKAAKTGYTISAGGNLAVLWQEPNGDTLGASVLGSSQSGRFTDILTLHDAADQYLEALRALPAYCTQ